MLKKCDNIWFDIQIEQRVATLRGNFFVGVNLGNNVFMVGLLSLIGIAHLPEKLAHLSHADSLEMRPCLGTNIGPDVRDALWKYAPAECQPIIGNLFHSLKLICSKILPKLSVSGNVKFDDIFDDIEDVMSDHLSPYKDRG